MPMQPVEIMEPLSEPSALDAVGTQPDEAETATVGANDKSRERKFGFVLCSMDSVRVPASRTSMEACKSARKRIENRLARLQHRAAIRQRYDKKTNID